MNIFQTVGLSAYYRFRRMSKAFRNWKRFGVIVFGSLFLASNIMAPIVANASADLTYLYIDPAAISVKAGQTYQFTAKAFDGSWSPVQITPTWSVVKTDAGTISSTGLFTASNVTGTYNAAVKLASGNMSAYAKVVVLANDATNPGTGGNTGNTGGNPNPAISSQLTYLYVDPAAISVEKGNSYQFVGRAYDQNWTPMQIPFTWSINRPAAGTVSATGLFTASQTKGTYENAVKLTAGNLSAYARVVVYGDDPQIQTCTIFEIHPNVDQISLPLVGGVATHDFSVIAKDTDGNIVPATDLNWRLSPQSIGQITNIGSQSVRFTATAAGQANLVVDATVCNQRLTDGILINVIGAPDRVLLRVDIKPDHPTILAGQSVTFTATAYDTNGQVINPATEPITFQWSFIGSGANLGTLANTTGQTTVFNSRSDVSGTFFNFLKVHATYKGVSAEATESITINQVSVQEIFDHVTATVDRNPINTNDSTFVRAQAYNNLGQPIANCAYNWEQLSGVGFLVQPANQQVATFASQSVTGSANLRVHATCFGTTKTADVSVSVVAAQAALTVQITPDPAYAAPNTNIVFTARAFEGSTEVTGNTSFNWQMLNGNAGQIVSTSGNTATVHTGSQLGTFAGAIQVTGTRSGMTGVDSATIVIQSVSTDVNIGASISASLDNRGTAVCTDDVITYVVTLSNNQPTMVNGVRVSMEVPARTNFVSALSSVGSSTISGRTITWEAGSLGFGQSKTLTIKVAPQAGIAGNATITANAFVTAFEKPNGFTVTANPINLVCGATPTTPDGKGPLAPTGINWLTLVGVIAMALGLAGITHTAISRRRKIYTTI